MSDAFGYGGGYVPKYQQQDPYGTGTPQAPELSGPGAMPGLPGQLPGLPGVGQRDPVSGGPDILAAKLGTSGSPVAPGGQAPIEYGGRTGVKRPLGGSYITPEFDIESPGSTHGEWMQKYMRTGAGGRRYAIDPLAELSQLGTGEKFRARSEDPFAGEGEWARKRLSTSDLLNQMKNLSPEQLRAIQQREGGFRGVQESFQRAAETMRGLYDEPGYYMPGIGETSSAWHYLRGPGGTTKSSQGYGRMHGLTGEAYDPRSQRLQAAYDVLTQRMGQLGYL